MVPGILIAAPLTAAGVYAYQRKNDLREILHPRALLAMLRASGTALIVPTFAFLGFSGRRMGVAGPAAFFFFHCRSDRLVFLRFCIS